MLENGEAPLPRKYLWLRVFEAGTYEVKSYSQLNDASFKFLILKFSLDGEDVLKLAEGLDRAAAIFARRSRIVAKPTDFGMAKRFKDLCKQISKIADFGESEDFSFFKSAIDRPPPQDEKELKALNAAITGADMQEFSDWIEDSGKMLKLVMFAEDKEMAWANWINKEGGNPRKKLSITPKEHLFAVLLPKLYTQVTANAYIVKVDPLNRELLQNEGLEFVRCASAVIIPDVPEIGTIAKHYFNYRKSSQNLR